MENVRRIIILACLNGRLYEFGNYQIFFDLVNG